MSWAVFIQRTTNVESLCSILIWRWNFEYQRLSVCLL